MNTKADKLTEDQVQAIWEDLYKALGVSIGPDGNLPRLTKEQLIPVARRLWWMSVKTAANGWAWVPQLRDKDVDNGFDTTRNHLNAAWEGYLDALR